MNLSKFSILCSLVLLILISACSRKQNLVKTDTSTNEKDVKQQVAEEITEVKETVEEVEEVKETVEETVEMPIMGKKIPVDERLIQGKLSNGMHYYIQANKKPENRAELRLAVNAGSVLEDEDQKGLAHFVEHMAFNGTKNFEKNELVDYLESTGNQFGADLNAYTIFDETVYMLQVRTDSMELFDKGLQIIRDWANDITFDDEEIDKERGVIESEWRTRLSADRRMQNKYFPVYYQGSQYAERLPIGDMDIVKNADYETLKRFYKDWYRPDLMAVAVVGDIDVTEVENQIKTLFGDIEPVENKRERTKFKVPEHEETLISIASDEEASLTNVQISYKHPKKYTKNLDDYRSSLVRGTFNNMMSARLDELSKSADPPFMFANTRYRADVGDIDSYSSFAYVPEGKSSAAIETLLTENKRVLQHGFTAGELERAKKRMIERAEKSFKEMDKTESRRIAMRYVYKYLDQDPTPSPKQTLSLYNNYLPSITLEEVNALPAQWIKDENRVVIVTGPEKEESPLPTEAEVSTMLTDVAAKDVAAYEDEVIDTPFFTKELSPAEITKTELYEDAGIEYMELANGVEVYLKHTTFKNDEIMMSATSPGGSSLYDDDVYFDARSASDIVNEAGLGEFNTIQMKKMMSGKTANVQASIGSLSEGFRGAASPDDVELMFQMIHKYFYEPRIDEEAFNSYITKEKGVFKNAMSDPRYYFFDYVNDKKYDNHPRMGIPDEEKFDNIQYERAMDLYKERFADASDFTFFFTGNYDKDIMTELIQKYLGDLPSINREETWKDTGVKAVRGGIVDRIKKGVAPRTNVHMYYHGDYEYNKDNNYLMQSMIAYLRIKLRETMREDMGGVYGVRLSGRGVKKPREQYGITISFNADPPETDGLIAAAKTVIETAIEEGPSEEDMIKVKETQRQKRIKDLEENRYWQRSIAREHEDGKAFDELLLPSLEKRIEGLTAAQIQQAIQQYFSKDNYIEIVMEPETIKED